MGNEASSLPEGAFAALCHTIGNDMPIALRGIFPFLSDGIKYAKLAISKGRDRGFSEKWLALNSINFAFKMLQYSTIEYNTEICEYLNKFDDMRAFLVKDLNVSCSDTFSPTTIVYYATNYQSGKDKFHSPQEILLAEAESLMRFAEDLSLAGYRFDSMLNYHAAAVFFRVILSLMPGMSKVVTPRLQEAVHAYHSLSPVSHNMVQEHFLGDLSCSDIYEVHGSNKLGKGSYGSVYMASHRITGEERAVKVMNVDRVTSYYLRKLHSEICILRAVDHPNIIRIQDVFFGKKSVYLVTDLCRGGELFELLNSGKSQGFVFREDRASRLMRDMVCAVNYLHNIGIVHRDLKLENFLFDSKSSTASLVLIDFGLSKFFDSKDEKMTQRVGSCYYTAPEVLNGCYDFRCDCWSLGVLCYMLLSGTPPFYGRTVDEVYDATLHQDLMFSDKKFKHVSPCCIDFMRRFLTKNPEHRMTTDEALRHPFLTNYVIVPPNVVEVTPTVSALPSLSVSIPVAGSSASRFLGKFSRQPSDSGVLSPTNSEGASQSSVFSTTSASKFVSNLIPTNSSASSRFDSSPKSATISSNCDLPSVNTLHLSSDFWRFSNCNIPSFASSQANTMNNKIWALHDNAAQSMISSLWQFNSSNALIRLILLVIGHRLSPDVCFPIRSIFEAIDSNRTGFITATQLRQAFSEFRLCRDDPIDFEKLLQALFFVDYDTVKDVTEERNHSFSRRVFRRPTSPEKGTRNVLGNVRISYHDFIAIMAFSNVIIPDDRISVVFSFFDPEQSGSLSKSSFSRVLGQDIGIQCVDEIFESSDWDKDGYITESDLKNCWKQFRRECGLESDFAVESPTSGTSGSLSSFESGVSTSGLSITIPNSDHGSLKSQGSSGGATTSSAMSSSSNRRVSECASPYTCLNNQLQNMNFSNAGSEVDSTRSNNSRAESHHPGRFDDSCDSSLPPLKNRKCEPPASIFRLSGTPGFSNSHNINNSTNNSNSSSLHVEDGRHSRKNSHSSNNDF